MDMTLPFWARFLPHLTGAPASQARTDPPQMPRSSPVFLYDVATPFAGETVLSYALKRDFETLLKDQ